MSRRISEGSLGRFSYRNPWMNDRENQRMILSRNSWSMEEFLEKVLEEFLKNFLNGIVKQSMEDISKNRVVHIIFKRLLSGIFEEIPELN